MLWSRQEVKGNRTYADDPLFPPLQKAVGIASLRWRFPLRICTAPEACSWQGNLTVLWQIEKTTATVGDIGQALLMIYMLCKLK